MTTAVNKIDSNFTGLRYAIEQSPGVLPVSPIWLPFEPNEYKSFGGEVTTKARRPISADRQMKKGVVVDVNAMGEFTQDVTPSNCQDILSSFLFANLRTKAELTAAVVDGAGNQYEPAAGGTGYQALDLLFAKGATNSLNNGIKVVTGAPDATHVAVTDTGLVDATGESIIISRVGYEFAQGLAAIVAPGSPTLPQLTVTNAAATSNYTITSTDNFADTETVSVGGTTYTAQTSFTAGAGHFLIGADKAASLVNLARAINQVGAGAGTLYDHASTAANAKVTATEASPMVATARVTGSVGNLVPTTDTATHGSWTSTTLAGGAGRDLTTLGLIPGEYVFIGGDDSTTNGDQFALATSNGYARLRTIASGALTFDKTEDVMVADAGTGKNIRIFFGRVLKNESLPINIVGRPIQMERTLGAPDSDAPGTLQAEYITRCYGDKATFDAKTSDIITLDMSFLGGTHETADGTVVPLKSGARPDIEETDAFNSTSDVSIIKMAVVTPGNPAPTPLFAFLTNFSIAINNNLTQNKAVSVLGAFDVSPGMFSVSVDVSAYFTTVGAIQSIKANDDVTLEMHMAKENRGISFDLPLITLGKGLAEVKLDQPVMLPLTADAATAKKIDTGLNHTLLAVFWDYLPDAAAA